MTEKRKEIVEDIKNKIFTIRGVQVMLDYDLAELYNVSTKVLNQAVKRNIDRFPAHFMFKLSEIEYNILKSQIVTSSWGGRRVLPKAFTEQGVAMLSGILKSNTAIKISIQIIDTFVTIRKFISQNAQIFQRLNSMEQKQLEFKLETNKKFKLIFESIENKEIQPKQGIFYDGQIFDAYKFVSDLVKSAKKSIVLIDNYVDDSVLTLFTKRNRKVKVTIYTKSISKQLQLDLKKYNEQYQTISCIEFKKSHDRFLIIDEKEVYHIGASLKDLGKKWFAFSKFDIESFEILKKLPKI